MGRWERTTSDAGIADDHVNLIFQATGADDNIDLYYARFAVNAQASRYLHQPAAEPADGGTTTYRHGVGNLTGPNTGNGVFTGGKYLAWASGVTDSP